MLESAFTLVERLRDSNPELKIELNCGAGSFKSQMKRADRSGARIALVIGEAEVTQQAAGLKPLREDTEQVSVKWEELGAALSRYFD